MNSASLLGHARTRAFTRTVQRSREPRDIHLPALGFKVDREVIAAITPPPELGADTYEVLRDLGYTDAELCRLAADAVI